MTTIKLEDNGQILVLSSNGQQPIRFHAFWLRDNALDETTRSTVNGQRIITLNDQPVNTYIDSFELDGTVLSLLFKPEDKFVCFDIHWLIHHAYDKKLPEEQGWLCEDTVLWDARSSLSMPEAQFRDVSNNEAKRYAWLHGLKQFGFAKLQGGPIESGALLTVSELFAFVRETNYGKVFDVKAEVNPTNLAYTGLALQAHTDNPYRDPVPGMQILYCLENSATGGESMVVDGFAVAKQLQRENARWFDLLSSHCARFEYAGDSAYCLQSKKPIIELGADGELIAIRFNNRSAAPFIDISFDKMPDYYAAYRRFAELLEEPDCQVSFKLSPGDCFVVDNTRVLHARNGYTGKGTRWLQGCYPDKDGFMSTLKVLEASMA